MGEQSPTYFGTCYRSGLTATETMILENPPVDEAFFYLITVELATGEGSMGTDSDGAERINASPCQ